MSAEITKRGVFDMQVCVPGDWTDEQVKEYADRANLCGTDSGWHIRKEGNELLAGSLERVKCGKREGYVHVMLDA